MLIHGLGSSRTVWDATRGPLEDHFDVIALDLPGFGDQPWFAADVPHSMNSLASAVEGELDRLGLERAHLVGNSMGGWVALELARRGRASDVIAISPVGGATPAEAKVSSRVMKGSRIGARLTAPTAGLMLRARALRRLGFRYVTSDPGDVDPDQGVTATRYMAGSTGFWKLVGDVAGGDDQFERNAPRLAQIACPVLILWGEEDRVLPVAGGPRMAAAIPGAELRVLPGVGHTPMLDKPGLVAELILERLR